MAIIVVDCKKRDQSICEIIISAITAGDVKKIRKLEGLVLTKGEHQTEFWNELAIMQTSKDTVAMENIRKIKKSCPSIFMEM
ncbi:MAG: hypothetical protein COX29_02415 [Candidatus Moranbacteria bacterium CG23_combo_of_CG06-09_8_20_14_all_35_22]|nr:MAG: hypothetical protein COX29_02415 [Candidatus Moranbacteria bacterium CG23_combo_of_CG06-09_8_20_14_all_35_22]